MPLNHLSYDGGSPIHPPMPLIAPPPALVSSWPTSIPPPTRYSTLPPSPSSSNFPPLSSSSKFSFPSAPSTMPESFSSGAWQSLSSSSQVFPTFSPPTIPPPPPSMGRSPLSPSSIPSSLSSGTWPQLASSSLPGPKSPLNNTSTLTKPTSPPTSPPANSPSPPANSPSPPANSRFKTKICRNMKENGTCMYGDSCQFAHSDKEVRNVVKHNHKYKTRLCQKYWINGYCAYGFRCTFVHYEQQQAGGNKDYEQQAGDKLVEPSSPTESLVYSVDNVINIASTNVVIHEENNGSSPIHVRMDNKSPPTSSADVELYDKSPQTSDVEPFNKSPQDSPADVKSYNKSPEDFPAEFGLYKSHLVSSSAAEGDYFGSYSSGISTGLVPGTALHKLVVALFCSLEKSGVVPNIAKLL